MAKPVFTDAQVVTTLTNTGGAVWASPTITYSFPSKGNNYSWEGVYFSGATGQQQAVSRYWMGAWDDLIGRSIVEVGAGTKSNITIANTYATNYAHAYNPGSNVMSGSVWFNPSYGNNSGTNNLLYPSLGQWGGMTVGHEIGHALGLSHPGNYNGGSPTYAANATHLQDSQMYSIMSYFQASNTGADWVASDGRQYFAQTPMMNDILAIQSLYGADSATRAGTTTYGFGSSLANSVYDFNANKHPVLCIYDAGGNDTLNLSGFNTSSKISLVAGSFSDCDMMTNNISIARNSIIENAIGGSANDILIGNDAANVLDGRAGADQMSGGLGNDTYILDTPLDKIVEALNAGLDNVLAAVTCALSANVENLTLTGNAAINGTGNELANLLTGNSAANALVGGAGNDILVGMGGKDVLTGGAGADTFRFIGLGDSTVGTSRDVITDFSTGDRIDLKTIDANTMVAGDQAFNDFVSTFAQGRCGQLRYADGVLAGDVNGDCRADFEVQVQLVGIPQLAMDAMLM